MSQPTLLLQTQKTQQLWNAASNDEISTYNVGKAHSYGALSEKKSAELVCTGLVGMHPCSALSQCGAAVCVPLAPASKCVRSWRAFSTFTTQKGQLLSWHRK